MPHFQYYPSCADVEIASRINADVRVNPKRKKVAIVGFATNSLHLVPWFDPEFELWGLNQGHPNFPRRADRWFEMHLPEATADVRDPQYLKFLRNETIELPEQRDINGNVVPPYTYSLGGIPVYMIQAYDEYPTSIRYPIEDAMQALGRDYFMSSVAFMLTLAWMEGFEEVHIYGVNLAIGDEYFYEKPNCEYIIGRMESAGVKFHIPQASSLLKQFRRYGYHVDARPLQNWKVLLSSREKDYMGQIERHQAEFNQKFGAVQELRQIMQIAEGMDVGADIVLVPHGIILPDLTAKAPEKPSGSVKQSS